MQIALHNRGMNTAKLTALAERVARLNPDCAEIGAGMLASLVADAKDALKPPPPARRPVAIAIDKKTLQARYVYDN